MNRRRLLITAPIFLTSCSLVGLTPNQALQQAALDGQTIAAGFKAMLPQLATVEKINAATTAKVGQYIADLQTVAANLAIATTTAAASPAVQQLEADINAIVTTLAGLPLPPQISLALQAAAILLPTIETAVGLAIQPPPPALAAKLRANPMTTDAARIYLKELPVTSPR